MNSKLALTSFTREYDHPKLCDIWSSRAYFSKFDTHELYRCRPSCFFVYSSRFYFKSSLRKVLNLIITLVYDFKPIVVKIIPFTSIVTTVSFAKDPFKPILFVGEESGQIGIFDLDNLNDVQFFRPNFSLKQPVLLSDWLDENFVLFSNATHLYGWNIENGQINPIFNSNVHTKITYFTCTSFQPNLVAIGLSDGELLIMNQNNDYNFDELCKLEGHRCLICCLSFSVGSANYANSVLASIDVDGILYVWNLDKKLKIFEDNKMNVSRERSTYYTITFMDDLYDFNDKTDLQQKRTIDSPEFIKHLSAQQTKDQKYFVLLTTDSNGTLFEYKVPKYPSNSNFTPLPIPFRIKQFKYAKNLKVLMPTSFQINSRGKIKKGDNQMFINNNNFPIIIQITQRNSCLNFLINNPIQKRLVQEIPLISNPISNIDFCRLKPNKMAIPDFGGFMIWNTPNFTNKNNEVYDLISKRKGFKHFLRVTCLQWHPDRENIIVIGGRDGQIIIYDTETRDNAIQNSIKLDINKYKSSYIYGISWGPNVLDKPKKDEKITILSPKQTFDYIYCLVGDGKISILNLLNMQIMDFREIADILLEKQWTELSWKSDYKLLAIGNKEGSVDVFSNDLFKSEKLKHIITINDVFKSPIESINWHPSFIKSLEDCEPENGSCLPVKVIRTKTRPSKLHSQISIGSTEKTIKIIDLSNLIEQSASEFDLPVMVNSIHRTLSGHEGRIFRTCWSTFRENHLLSSSEDFTIRVWNCNLRDGHELWKTFYGHFGSTYAVRWSLTEPDIVYSGGNDSILLVWNINEINNEKPKPIKIIQSNSVITKSTKFQSEVNEYNEIDEEESQSVRDEEENDSQLSTNGEEIEIKSDGIHKSSDFKEANNFGENIESFPMESNSIVASNSISLNNSLSDRLEDEKEKSLSYESSDKNKVPNDFDLNSGKVNSIATNDKVQNFSPRFEFNKSVKRKSTKKESKPKSLLTLSTCYDNNLSKLEHLGDIDKMILKFKNRKNQASDTSNDNSFTASIGDQDQLDTLIHKNPDEDKKTCLLYGSDKDIEDLSKLEAENHLQNADPNSACLVKLLSMNLETVIDEAIKQDQLNEFLVSMSPSISLEYYQKTTLNYVDQLIRKGKIIIAASYLLSLFRIKDALDLLVKFKMYKEALMIAKTRFTSNDNVYVRVIAQALAHDYSKSGNFESEAKCWLSIDHYYEAARVLAIRIDPLSTRYAVKCCKIAHKYELEN